MDSPALSRIPGYILSALPVGLLGYRSRTDILCAQTFARGTRLDCREQAEPQPDGRIGRLSTTGQDRCRSYQIFAATDKLLAKLRVGFGSLSGGAHLT